MENIKALPNYKNIKQAFKAKRCYVCERKKPIESVLTLDEKNKIFLPICCAECREVVMEAIFDAAHDNAVEKGKSTFNLGMKYQTYEHARQSGQF
jgi:hypothetical protein